MTDTTNKIGSRAKWGTLLSLLKQFSKHKGGMIAAWVFLFILTAVVLGPFFYRIDPQQINLLAKNKGPSWDFWLGTDNLGRDNLAQLLAGGRVSLAVGVCAMAISVAFGSLLGIVSGYSRKLDAPIMRVTDLFLALPILPLLLVIMMLFRDTLRSNFGPELGIFILIVAVISLTSWMQTARLVRSEVLSLKEKDFVLAAHASGTTNKNIVIHHILPNIMSPVMVSATLGIASAIITESALSFLGLGFPSDFPTWGRLLFDGAGFMVITPLRVLWPGLAISLTVLSVNFMGDAIRDALDPKLRSRRSA